MTASIALGIGAVGHFTHNARSQGQAALISPSLPQQALQAAIQTAPMQALAEAGADMAAAIAEKPVAATREAEIDDGETFAEMLSGQGVSDAEAAAAMNALAKVYDLRKLQAGQNVTLSFLLSGTQESFSGATFQPEDTKEVRVLRAADNGFAADVKTIPVTHRRMAASAEINSSLYEAGDRAGVPHAVMAALIRTYSHDVDFQRDIHPGDSFEVLYDQPITAKGRAVGEGTIIYAALHVGGKVRPLYRVTFSDGTIDYFDETGHSVRRALLRTPVAAARITSGFGMRMHPLLGYSKMHKGVDFGAPMGAPIFAAGNGVIDDIGFRSGYGRYIRIRHANGMQTAYAHMSRFNAKLYHGARVNQGEVIGYVGMSGRATGPHLHFEVLMAGRQVNPMSIKNMPTGRPLEGKLLAAFRAGQSRIQKEFADLLSAQSRTTQGASLIPASATVPVATPKQAAKL